MPRATSKSATDVKVNPDDDPKIKDAKTRYISQCELIQVLRTEWVKLKRPATQFGGATGRTIQVHTLVKEIQAAEKLADMLLRSIHDMETPRRAPGRPVGASSAPDRKTQAAGRIRRIA